MPRTQMDPGPLRSLDRRWFRGSDSNPGKLRTMRTMRLRMGRMLLATCAGSFFILILYFQGSARFGTESLFGGSRWPGKSRRNTLQAKHEDQSNCSSVQAALDARRSLLSEACGARARPRRVLSREDLRHLLVDDRHGLLYCYVPKVACTNWKRVLMVLTGDGRYRRPLDIPAHEAHAPGRLRSLADYPPPEINRRLRTYLKFLFVREPFERLVSAYRNKFTRPYNAAFHRRYGTRIVRRHRARPAAQALETGADVSFREFVHYLVDPRTRREEPFNEHWERAHALCHPCLIRYDVVGKYESLARDARHVLRLAGARLAFPDVPASARTTESMAARYFHGVGPAYQRKLYNLYRMDFLLFNYSRPAYLKFD